MSENTRRPRPPGGEERGVFTDALQAGWGYALGKAAVEIVADKLRQAEDPAREEVAALSARVPFSVCGRQGRTPLAATGGVGAAADARRSAAAPAGLPAGRSMLAFPASPRLRRKRAQRRSRC
jgi:hypothetical protein